MIYCADECHATPCPLPCVACSEDCHCDPNNTVEAESTREAMEILGYSEEYITEQENRK